MNKRSLNDKILKMRMNEFGLSKIIFFGQPQKDVFPHEINVEVYKKTEPRKVYSLELKENVISTENKFSIARLIWDDHEEDWKIESIGTRYLEYSNEELNKWLLDFCKKYIVDGDDVLERTIFELD